MAETLTTLTQIFEMLAAAIAALGTVIAALSVLFKPLREWFTKRFNLRGELEAQIKGIDTKVEERFTKFDEQMAKLTELVEASHRESIDQNAAQNKDMELIKNATLASTRNTLTYLSRKAREKGSVTSNDRENYDKMYQAYTELGGNSYVHRLYDEYMQMPIVE